MLTPRIAKRMPQHVRQPRPGDSRAHLEFIRKLPCCVTGYFTPVEAHHLLRADNRPKGVGRKNLDKYAIPLSASAHKAAHAHGNDEAWLAGQGIDGRALAAALWRVTGDLDKGRRIVSRAKRVEAK